MSSIEQIDAEIARLQAELASVERMPRPISERYDEAAARLREAEGVYRQWGFDASAGHPGEAQHVQRQSLIGALMVANSAALLKVEREKDRGGGPRLERAREDRAAGTIARSDRAPMRPARTPAPRTGSAGRIPAAADAAR